MQNIYYYINIFVLNNIDTVEWENYTIINNNSAGNVFGKKVVIPLGRERCYGIKLTGMEKVI